MLGAHIVYAALPPAVNLMESVNAAYTSVGGNVVTLRKKMSKKSLRWRGENDDIENILNFVEMSYDLELEYMTFKKVDTFGAFCDKIIAKIKLQDTDDNTSDQGFRKLRSSVEKIRGIKNFQVELNTKLTDIFPIKSRRKDILEIERMLDVKFMAFRSSHIAQWIVFAGFLIVAFCFWIDWKIGAPGLLLLVIISWLSDKTACTFRDNTFGELTERMITYNYLKSRENPMTVNKREIEDLIKKLFAENWGFKEKDIGRETLI